MIPIMPKDQCNESMPILNHSSFKTVTATTSTQSAILSATEETTITFFALDDRIWIKVALDPTAVAEADDNMPLEAGKDWTRTIPAGQKFAVIGGKYCYGIV